MARAHPLFDVVPQKGHGRLERWHYQVYAVEPQEVGLPHARSLIVVEKSSRDTAGKKGESSSRRVYISSLESDRVSAGQFGELIRGHWGGCEIRNHRVRDSIFGEDRTRSRNWNVNANLALLRAVLLGVKADLLSDLS